ncbi:hypothetical protein NQ318_016574 [Aromia moschata]|uniref:Uncharacterized protein n=1 Tax=Aromia moschata TaxID=1265417 RepID=A0AAV8YYK2_9CUCU|nr:hypothetical protein NQ318_016574 [Aromia moschata]
MPQPIVGATVPSSASQQPFVPITIPQQYVSTTPPQQMNIQQQISSSLPQPQVLAPAPVQLSSSVPSQQMQTSLHQPSLSSSLPPQHDMPLQIPSISQQVQPTHVLPHSMVSTLSQPVGQVPIHQPTIPTNLPQPQPPINQPRPILNPSPCRRSPKSWRRPPQPVVTSPQQLMLNMTQPLDMQNVMYQQQVFSAAPAYILVGIRAEFGCIGRAAAYKLPAFGVGRRHNAELCGEEVAGGISSICWKAPGEARPRHLRVMSSTMPIFRVCNTSYLLFP